MGKRLQNYKRLLLLSLIMSHLQLPNAEIRFKNSAYENIIIDIKETVPVPNCSKILKELEIVLTSASRHLFTALDGRGHFGKIIINLPQTWPDECVPGNQTVSPSTGEKSDITVTPMNRLFGNRIWTKQSGGCGVKGEQIYLSYHSFNSPTIGKEFVREWAKYRYGIFDEIGYDEDEIYPKCHFTDSQHITGCSDGNVKDTGICQNGSPYSDLRKVLDKRSRSSIMFVPQADHVIMFCDQSTHDRYAPTKHNLLCERLSTLEVILKHKDFRISQTIAKVRPKNIDSTVPIFEYRRRLLTRYVLIIDETQDALIRESWKFFRNAIRKWVFYDLRPNTEIGIVLANNTSFLKILDITPIEQQRNRDLIASFIPYVPGDSRQAACIHCGIRAAIGMLLDKRNDKGASSDVALIIAPGVDLGSNYKDAVDLAILNNVKIVTINYPGIVRRNPMDMLAELTSGLAFTVLEQRYNSEKTFLNTYFELSMTLFHISAEYYEGPKHHLPIEIYRKELKEFTNDTDTRRITRTLTDTFYMDDTVRAPSGVYLYTHNVEQPLIQNLKLISPDGMNFVTRSDQRMPVKQLTLIALINSTGLWTYKVERFNGNPQSHFIQVLATPQSAFADYFNSKFWFTRLHDIGPLIFFCEILHGIFPVHYAEVIVYVTRPDIQCNETNNCVKMFTLLDSGTGDPDITKGDGIYSRYFSALNSGPGLYKFDIVVTNNKNSAYTLPDNAPYLDMQCCGSVISTKNTRPTDPFQRYLPTITILITEEDIENELKMQVGRIGDLTVDFVEHGLVRLTWTSPDMGGQNVARYNVKYALSIQDIVDNFETAAIEWKHNVPRVLSIGQLTNLLIDINHEPSLFGQAVFFAVRPYSIVSDTIPGPISNPVRTFIPINAKPTNPLGIPNTRLYSNVSDFTNITIFDDMGKSSGNQIETDIKFKYIFPILAAFICVSCLYILYCSIFLYRKRQAEQKERREEEEKENNVNKDETNSNAIPQSTSMPDIRNQYQSPKNSAHSSPVHENDYSNDQQEQHPSQKSPIHSPNNLDQSQSNHHIIGIPIYDDDDHDDGQGGKFHKFLNIDEINQPHHQVEHVEIISPPSIYNSCAGLSIISSNSHTLPRQGRHLSPYESWTASQLLHEHERRTSPMEEVADSGNLCIIHKHLKTPDEISLNGIGTAPPVPPLPYGGDGYKPMLNYPSSNMYGIRMTPSVSSNLPIIYNTISRAHPLQVPSSSSVQDPINLVSGTDKRRRNVTMV